MAQIQAAAAKESVVSLYADEIVELTNQADQFVKKIEGLQENLGQFKKVSKL